MSEITEMKISIPRRLYDQIQRKILGTDYQSVEDYVRALIQQAIGDESIVDQKRGLSPKEEEEMKEKLKTLGYL